jgi:hypothetical protein
MVQTRKMNQELFSKLHKELTISGELIRARQEEKQGLLDEFAAETKRFFFGKISERSLASSVKKTNKELKRLNHEIRKNITRVRRIANRAGNLASAQAPIPYRATMSGIGGLKAKKKVKKRKKKKVKKRKAKKKRSKKRKKKK